MKANTKALFNTEGPIFMLAKRELTNCNVAIYGVSYDGTTSFRPGARFGPTAIRQVSNGIESFCPQLKIDLTELNFADLGELEITFGNPEPVINKVEIDWSGKKLILESLVLISLNNCFNRVVFPMSCSFAFIQ